ncbi:non-ribosomal peptide synthetase [Streptomyces sp. KPB2]|uniref:non-ribosomal peptide synthetase n=1 Tax=Streptomyces sp. KPB2 TaxID=2305221 RepID=UPI0013E09D45|nr:non-ribosomal peptide synthetase [Streptomyces sp. KPB2]
MTHVDDQLPQLSAAQRRLLESMTGGRRPGPGTEPDAPPTDRAPAGHAQRRMWLVHKLAPGPAFTVPILYRIAGPLDVPALTDALTTLLERHEILRTTYHEADGELRQRVEPVPSDVLSRHSVTGLADHLRDDAAQRLVHAEAARPFDLARGPVFRAALVRTDSERWLLLLTIHHIACDQWSMGVFVRELAAVYEANTSQTPVRLPAPGRTYAEYAREQAARERDGGFQAGLAYWRETLKDLRPLTLPTDRPRPAEPAQLGGEVARWVEPEVARRVRACAARCAASPFMVVLAAFLVVMRAYQRHDDLAVGTTAAGRESEDLAGVIGFFVNTNVLRTEVRADDTFADVVASVKAAVLGARPHADIPFELVVDALEGTRDGTGRSVTPVLFQQDNTPDSALRLTGLDVALDDDFLSGTAKYDLLVSVRNRPDGTRLHFQYDAELFDRSTAARMLDAYETCLAAAVREPERTVRELPVMSDAEAAELARHNDTDRQFDLPGSLHGLFARATRATPDALALVDVTGARRSFREVSEQADRVARALVRRGVGRGDTVGVRLQPGAHYLAAVLGTMAAGAAFVPIDPHYPAERVALISSEADLALLVDDTGLDVPTLTAEGRDADVTLPEVGPDDPAYVIFTSGSTGRPKGVVIRHGGILNNLADLAERLGLGPDDRVLTVSSPSFDMSVFELLGVPCFGGAAVVVDHELARDPAHWEEMATRHAVTVWNSAPALLELFLGHLESGSTQEAPPLRVAVLGGDWVPLGAPARWYSLFPDSEFTVLGGATEASIHSTFYSCASVDPGWKSIPYGRPMANQTAVVVDDDGRPSPIGVPGHLLLGGAGLAAGYHRKPELTAERFVHVLGERRYRTGDIAKWRPDGQLELLGRDDDMIKIHGLRIEPGDVESALHGTGDLTGVAVVAAAAPGGGKELVAWVTSDREVDTAALRDGLKKVLPAFMVPARIQVLDAFPLSPNGKVDRRALAAREAAPTDTGPRSEPPATPTERRVAEAWAQVLGATALGRNDDFFELGGDSFKAVRAARLVAGDLPASAVFRHPTVAALADHIDRGGEAGSGTGLLLHLSASAEHPPSRDEQPVPVVCLPHGGGNAVVYQALADTLGAGFDVWAVNLPGHDLADREDPQSIREVARRCADEIAERFTGPVVVYGQCAGCAAAVRLARACEARGVEVRALFVGAALPDQDPAESMRLVREADDDLLLGHIRGLGGLSGVLDDSDLMRMLRVVRHDLAEMITMYSEEHGTGIEPVRAPVHCVVGSEDPATPGYEQRYTDWGRYGTGVTLSVIEGGEHYFCKHRPDDLAGVIRERLAADVSREGRAR